MAEFRNPNLQGQEGGGTGGDSRGMMALTLLAVAVFFAFQYFAKPKQSPATAPSAQSQSQSLSVAPAASVQAMTAAHLHASSPVAPAPTPSIIAAAVATTTVENADIKVVFTNQGAQAEHWILMGKQYLDHPNPGAQQLDLVNPRTTGFGLPLSLYTYEPELTRQLNSALYQVTTTGAASSAGVLRAPCTITFHYAANGLDVVKTFRFDTSYVVTAEVKVTRNSVPVRALLAWPGGLGDQTDATQFVAGKFAWLLDGKDDTTDAKKVSSGATLDQPYDYTAVEDLYFAAAFLPDVPASTTVVTLHNAIDLPGASASMTGDKKPADVIGLAVGDTSGVTRLRLFAGPKETDLLKNIRTTGSDGKLDGPSLESLIRYGMWTIIAKPLYLALRGLHNLLGSGANNWGWAIIIFTAIFTILTLPLRYISMKSSLKMMRVQPKMDAIKNKYKNLKATDPRRAEMNAETMDLYKAEGVNMYGSCLPMLPQMPLLFAYYDVLENAVNLRQAHWFWLTDLSVFDPYYILSGIIIVSMFFTQMITPTPGMSPEQRRMMAFGMPIFMGFMFAHLASGLSLYMCVSYCISLAFQLIINRFGIGKEMHEIAAQRAAKKDGGRLKTIQGRR